MVIENKGYHADKLIGAYTNIAEVVELHETVGGKTRRKKALEIPSGKRVELKPGGYHLTLINLTEKPKEGQKVVCICTKDINAEHTELYPNL